jgi:flagellar basal-body rod protein FlgB
MNIFNLVAHKMDWLSERHKIISNNIANSSTPGFKAKDIQPFDDNAFSQIMLSSTQANHIKDIYQSAFSVKNTDTRGWENSLSNNNVNLEEQFLKVNDIAEHYFQAINMTRYMQRIYLSSIK